MAKRGKQKQKGKRWRLKWCRGRATAPVSAAIGTVAAIDVAVNAAPDGVFQRPLKLKSWKPRRSRSKRR
jgi:hypothetical protein